MSAESVCRYVMEGPWRARGKRVDHCKPALTVGSSTSFDTVPGWNVSDLEVVLGWRIPAALRSPGFVA